MNRKTTLLNQVTRESEVGNEQMESDSETTTPDNEELELLSEACCRTIFTTCYNGHSNHNDSHCQVNVAT